jgi:hypothetical protein
MLRLKFNHEPEGLVEKATVRGGICVGIHTKIPAPLADNYFQFIGRGI